MDIVEKYPDKPWNWKWLSENSNFTLEIIQKNIGKPWNWYWLSKNPNISIKFIERHIDKIKFKELSSNLFTFQKKLDRIRIKVFGLWILNSLPYILGDSLKRCIIQGYL